MQIYKKTYNDYTQFLKPTQEYSNIKHKKEPNYRNNYTSINRNSDIF